MGEDDTLSFIVLFLKPILIAWDRGQYGLHGIEGNMDCMSVWIEPKGRLMHACISVKIIMSKMFTPLHVWQSRVENEHYSG